MTRKNINQSSGAAKKLTAVCDSLLTNSGRGMNVDGRVIGLNGLLAVSV